MSEDIEIYSHDSEEIDFEVLSSTESDIVMVCRFCGKKLVANESNSYGLTCGRVHYSKCVICGSEVNQDKNILNGTKLSAVCKSRECRNKYSGMRSKQAIQKKYGVDNTFQLESVKEKSRQTNLENRGVEYAVQSSEVKQKLHDSLMNKSEKEKELMQQKRKQTCIDKYGVDNPFKLQEFRDKSKETCIQRYGVEYASQSEKFRQSVSKTWSDKTEEELETINFKRIQTTREKYGVDYACQNLEVLAKLIHSLVDKSDEEKQDIRQKTEQTCLNKYGTKSPAENEDVKEKIQKTIYSKYGVNSLFELPEFREYLKYWCLENYGVENPFQSKEIREKGKQTSIRKYGTEYPMQSKEMRKRVSESKIRSYANTIEDPVYRQNYLDFMNDPVEYVHNHFDSVPTYSDLYHSLGDRLNSGIYSKVPKELGMVQPTSSAMEDEVEKYIKSLDESIVIIRRDHDIISPYELDLYLPQYRIAIECNPTYTHNSSLPSYSNEKPLDYMYHKMKTDLCESKGVFLFHIFGYEWNHKQEIIKSMIRNLLCKNENRYYARNLSIVKLSSLECREFLGSNHRQGSVNSSIRLGLRTKDNKLVSVMTFGKMRSTIGRSDSNHDYELVRFCNTKNTTVVGGASKLFRYFLKNYRFNNIVSFSDRSHTRGNLYETLGFIKENESSPNYVWVNMKNDTWYNRVTCQKQNLRNLFKEPELDMKNQTEKQIMVSHGYVQVYDSGIIKWVYKFKR